MTTDIGAGCQEASDLHDLPSEAGSLRRPIASLDHTVYEPTTDRDKFGQGDVIRFISEAARPDNAAIAVVVTADCDLVHNKYQGVLSVVPAYHLDEFLHSHRFAAIAKDSVATLAEKIVTALVKQYGQIGLSQNSLVDWIHKTPPELVAASLAETAQDKSLQDPNCWLRLALGQLHNLALPGRVRCVDYCRILAGTRRFLGDVQKPVSINSNMMKWACDLMAERLDPREKLPSD